MNTGMEILILAAAFLGFIHTILGPDHYLPFIMMSRAGKWSMLKTGLLTCLCGLGHVISSAAIGFIGIVFGMGVMKLEALEAFRGNLAAWCLMGFGLAYAVWGLHRARRDKLHTHLHVHEDGTFHAHVHSHQDEHAHVHVHDGKTERATPWVLFIIFVFGPCEPLIPILMYPAAKNSMSGILLVTATFGIVTIMTMLAIVMAGTWGLHSVRLGTTERYAHALAGAVVGVCGLAMQCVGW